jgi:hypothetical protein
MRKIYLTVLFLVLCSSANLVHAQASFSHSFGASQYFSDNMGAWGFTYSPRVNVVELHDEATISVGTHLGAGIQYSRYGNSFWVLDLPLAVELNLGHASSPLSDANFGAFLGGGYNFMQIRDLHYDPAFSPAPVHGPMVNGGIRAFVFDIPFTLRAAYTLNVSKGKEQAPHAIAVGLFYNLN